MNSWTGRFAALAALIASGAAAAPAVPELADPASEAADALPYRQCVPYARQQTGIAIYGDALTWWDQAAGRYARGHQPRVGAVMSFKPYGSMTLGHVAAVSRVIDSRTVLLSHANWSLINGRRGQIEQNVRAIDVSPDNDWSEVRVWFAPIQALGTTRWPLNGFIYPQQPGAADRTVLAARAPAGGHRSLVGADFLNGIAGIAPAAGSGGTPRLRATPRHAVQIAARHGARAAGAGDDPIGRIIAARMR